MSQSIKTSKQAQLYSPSLIIDKAKGDYLWDSEGKKYLDFTGGIAVNSLGHADPQIRRHIKKQMKKIMHCSNLFTTVPNMELCDLLVQKANEAFQYKHFASTFLCNSGTEANEAALKFSRLLAYRNSKQRKHEIISFQNSFHGRSMGALSVTGQERYKTPFMPLVPGCILLPYNDTAALTHAVNDSTAAIIVEVIQGEGGLDELSKTTADCIQELARKHQVLIIADEVQTGLYRTGSFFASLDYGLNPDIITLAKSLGGGLPAGAVLCNKNVQDVLKIGDHGTTMGGNPLSAAAALSFLNRLENAAFQNKRKVSAEALDLGIMSICKEQDNLIPLGRGHLRGLHFNSENIDSSVISQILTKCKEQGLLILRTGTNSLRIAPSLHCPPKIIEQGLKILQSVHTKLAYMIE